MTMSTDIPASAVQDKPAGPDMDRYRHHVDHLNISDARKAEFLEAVWRIMSSFVDRAFGDDPTQLARIAGDKGDRERASASHLKIGSGLTSQANYDGDLAGVFRRCGEGE